MMLYAGSETYFMQALALIAEGLGCADQSKNAFREDLACERQIDPQK